MGSFLSSPSFPDSRIVDTNYGKLQGRRLITTEGREADAFQGVPYAKPPVGQLRFKKPVPPDAWTGVRSAKKWPNRCMQKDFSFQNYPRDQVKGDEDCLYLNVFTPAWEAPKEGFPVIVYIHGGSFMMDGTATYGDVGICKYLVSREGCVVVTIQYRLGYLGYFTVGDESLIPHNLAFWDMTLALHWVNDNIEAFGGDKHNITVIGQSAGGVATDALSLSHHSRDLFHKVVPLGGTVYCPWANNDGMQRRCEEFARGQGLEWKTQAELVEKLMALPADVFLIDDHYTGDHIDSDFACVPTWDCSFFDNRSIRELRGEVKPKPFLAGVNNLEGLLFTSGGRRPDEAAGSRILDFAIPRDLPDRERVKREFYSKYLDPSIANPSEPVTRRARLEVWSDAFMNGPILRLVNDWLEANRGTDNNVFLYNFEYYNPKQFGWYRWLMTINDATHDTDLIYLLGKDILIPFPFNADDYKMCEITTKAFANFAKYGDPNGKENDLPSRWEALDDRHPERNYSFRLHPRTANAFFKGHCTEIIEMHSAAPGDPKWPHS